MRTNNPIQALLWLLFAVAVVVVIIVLLRQI